MSRISVFTFIFLGFFFPAAVSNADMDLARNGKCTSVLVLAPDVDPGIQQAAADLQIYFEKITGAPLELSLTLGGSTPAQGKVLIMITTTDKAGKLLTPEMKKKLSGGLPDACALKGSGKRILIVGNSVLGARNGIYVFLQKYLGCRWFYPGEMGEYYPKNPTISLKPFDDFHNPSYKRRELGCFSVFKGTWDYNALAPPCRRSAPLSPFLRRLPPSKTHDYEFSLLTSQAKYPMIQLSVFCKIAYIKAIFPLCPF